MRPATLAEAYELMIAREPREAILSEFLDSFYLASTPEQRLACLRDEPRMTGDTRLDALAGAVAEYLAKQYRLPSVPAWTFEPCRYLDRAWHDVSLVQTDDADETWSAYDLDGPQAPAAFCDETARPVDGPVA